jgi:hypothetical protein
MPLFRLLTTGLCVACVVMLATMQPGHVPCTDGFRSGAPCRDGRPPISIIDVADRVDPGALPALVHLRPGERVSAINDRALGSDLEAGALIASLAPRAGEFLDLTVSSARSERRVLVLMH